MQPMLVTSLDKCRVNQVNQINNQIKFIMSNQVKITANDDGQVVIPSSNNPEFAYIRVEQENQSLEGGFYNDQTRSAIIGGRTEELKEAGFKEGQTLPGKIIVEERVGTPFYDGQEPKINPQTSEILTKDGEPIYRQSRYTRNMSLEDDLKQHDNISQGVSESQEEEEEVSITG